MLETQVICICNEIRAKFHEINPKPKTDQDQIWHDYWDGYLGGYWDDLLGVNLLRPDEVERRSIYTIN